MNTHAPQRMEGESFFDYKQRRIASRKAVALMKKGIVFWNSGKSGTYINPKRKEKKAA